MDERQERYEATAALVQRGLVRVANIENGEPLLQLAVVRGANATLPHGKRQSLKRRGGRARPLMRLTN